MASKEFNDSSKDASFHAHVWIWKKRLVTLVTNQTFLKAFCCCGALILGYGSFKLYKQHHVKKSISKLYYQSIWYLKTKYHFETLLIQVIPTSYYIILPHILHQTILCLHTIHLQKNNTKYLKYMISAKYLQYGALYSLVYFVVLPFLFKYLMQPFTLQNIQHWLFSKVIKCNLQRRMRKEQHKINHLLFIKYQCIHEISDVIWLYVGEIEKIQLSKGNIIIVNDFVGELEKNLSIHTAASVKYYQKNPLLWHSGGLEVYDIVECDVNSFSMATFIFFKPLFKFLVKLWFSELFFAKFKYIHFDKWCYDFIEVVNPFAFAPSNILIELLVNRDYIFGMEKWGCKFFETNGINDNELKQTMLKNWNFIVQRGNNARNWYQTVDNGMRIKYNDSYIAKEDLSK